MNRTQLNILEMVMRPLRKPLIACAAAIALAGVAGLAVAVARNAHVLDVRLPDGALAHIRYVGDTPPIVTIAPPPTISILSPIVDPSGAVSPFAALDRLSQVIDRQADALFREAAGSELALTKPRLTQIDLGKLPDGAQGFVVVSTASGKEVCTRSVEFRSSGDGKPGEVVNRSSGACTAAEKGFGPPEPSSATDAATRPDHSSSKPI